MKLCIKLHWTFILPIGRPSPVLGRYSQLGNSNQKRIKEHGVELLRN